MTTRIRGVTCASCQRFPLDSVDAGGAALCAIREKPERFDNPACVLYEQASDHQQRRATVAKLKQTAQE